MAPSGSCTRLSHFAVNLLLVSLVFGAVAGQQPSRGDLEDFPPIDSLDSDVNATDEGQLFVLRKCCDLGQVFHISDTGKGQCLNFSSAANHATSFLETTRQLFFPDYRADDFNISIGMPDSCDARDVIRLEPDVIFGDRFFPHVSGHLILPHRFWHFESAHYCMEDFFFGPVFSKATRSAFICTTEIRNFPPEAVDLRGRLNFKFLPQGSKPTNFSTEAAGRTVVRKCCDLFEVYAAQSGFCNPGRGYATQYFDDLKSNHSVFLRFGNMDCPELELTPPGTDFELTPTGHVHMTDGDKFDVLLGHDSYCLDDFVRFTDDELPETVNQAWYCADQIVDVPPEIPVETEVHVDVPKCCGSGEIWSQGKCHSLNLDSRIVARYETVLINSFRKQYTEQEIQLDVSLVQGPDLLCEDPKQAFMSGLDNDSWITPYFNEAQGNTTFKIQYLWTCPSSSWRMNISVQHFCVEMEQYKTSREVSFYPVVRYCPPANTEVSVHYPIMLHISTAALIATFWIYFIAPAQAVSKVTISKSGQKANNRPVSKLSDTLFGKNLLSQIASLVISFLSLSLGQLKFVVPGHPGCAILAFFLYWSSIASFTWLTVLSFDLWWQFRSSMKIPDNTRFIPYSIFAWGLPTLAVVVAIAAQYHPDAVPCSVNPRFGLLRCWFASDESMVAFFYGPVGVLVVLNISFFLMLMFSLGIFSCCKGKDMARESRSSGSKGVASQKSNSVLAFELFFITGIPWIFEILAWLPALRGLPGRKEFFSVVNILNAMRGLFVFVIFILLRPTVVRFLASRLKDTQNRTKKLINRAYSNTNSFSHASVTASDSISTVSSSIEDNSRQSVTRSPSVNSDTGV